MLASVDPRNFNLIFLNRFLPHHQRKQSAWTVWRTGKNQSIIPVKFHNTAERFSNKIKCKLYTPIPDRAIFNHRVKVWANFAESLYILLSVLFLKEKLWISWFQTKILKNCILTPCFLSHNQLLQLCSTVWITLAGDQASFLSNFIKYSQAVRV